jgi:hypothetical protein
LTDNREKITNISAVVVISSPDGSEHFLSRKDDTYPIVLMRGCICPLGGNWNGKDAAGDVSPLATLHRELREELTLRRPIRDGAELKELGLASGDQVYAATASNGAPIQPEDEDDLASIVEQIASASRFSRALIHVVTEEAIKRADPTSDRKALATLCFVFEARLAGSTWARLKELQGRYGNLSNEAPTEILTTAQLFGERFAFGHDASIGRTIKVVGLPPTEGVTSLGVDVMPKPYSDLLRFFNPEKRPPGC